MTREEKLAYARGYQTRAEKWPAHKPPLPPDPIIAALMEAARQLRDAVDTECAMFDPDDEMAQRLYVGVDAVDEAMRRVSLWLREREE